MPLPSEMLSALTQDHQGVALPQLVIRRAGNERGMVQASRSLGLRPKDDPQSSDGVVVHGYLARFVTTGGKFRRSGATDEMVLAQHVPGDRRPSPRLDKPCEYAALPYGLPVRNGACSRRDAARQSH